MFLGEYEHTMDEKGRVAIPARYREALTEGLIITRGFDNCLMGFPRSYWSTLAERISTLPLGLADVRNLQRMVFANANDLTFDRQGRVLIPQTLRERVGLGDQVVIAGVYTHFEIWSKSRWDDVLTSLDANSSKYAEQLAAIGL